MSDRVGIAIIGCGSWGMNYVRVFNELPRAQVVAVCDQRAERLKDVHRQFPDLTATTDIEQALSLPGVDAAVVCTNASSHFDVARHVLEAKKHLLLEKPMATTSERAEKLLILSRAQGVKLMIGHIFLYNAGVRKVKSYMEQNQIGEFYYLYSRRTNLGPIRSDVNALWDLAPHDVSIFNYLLGQLPEWVSAVATRALHNGREDVGFIVLGYPNNVLGHIHVSWAEPHKVREVVVVGSEKRIVFDDLDPLERVRIFEKGVAPVNTTPSPSSYGEYQYSFRDGDIISPKVEINEPLKAQCNHFLDCVIRDEKVLTDGEAGYQNVKILEAANRSVSRRGAPVELTWDKEHEQTERISLEDTYEYTKNVRTVH